MSKRGKAGEQGKQAASGGKGFLELGGSFFRREPSEVNKQERMKFIALKTCDGGAKGRISFCCKALKVTRQGFHEYLKNRNKPWRHEELAAKMMEILHEDECNDTYGRERMHKALLLKYPDSGIPGGYAGGIPPIDEHILRLFQ